MKFEAEVNIMPQKALLDPQGKAVVGSLKNIELSMIADVRVGKHIIFNLEANDEAHAKLLVTEACEKMLANLIMESFDISIKPIH